MQGLHLILGSPGPKGFYKSLVTNWKFFLFVFAVFDSMVSNENPNKSFILNQFFDIQNAAHDTL